MTAIPGKYTRNSGIGGKSIYSRESTLRLVGETFEGESSSFYKYTAAHSSESGGVEYVLTFYLGGGGGMNVVIHSPGHSELPAEYSFSAGEGESVGSRSDCVGGRKRSILMWGTAANTKSPILNSRKFCQRTTLHCSQSRACLWERNVEQGLNMNKCAAES